MNRLQNSNLPFINLSKENLFLVCDMLELDEIGLLIVAIKEYLYEGKEPNLNTKPLRSAWSQVLMLIDRKADSYFTRKEQMEKINKSKKDKKTELTQASKSSIKDVKPEDFELPNCQIPNTADLSPSNDEEVEQPQPIVNNTTEAIKIATEEFITDEDKYGIDVVDLIDENPEIINALKSVVEYRCGDHSKLMEAQGANSKIEIIVKSKSHDANFINRVERFCADYIKEYTEYVINNVKVKQIA